MTVAYRCEDCNGLYSSAGEVSTHLINVHGMDRERAHASGAAARVDLELRSPRSTRPAPPVRPGDRNLARARSHAEVAGLLAIVVLVVGLIIPLVIPFFLMSPSLLVSMGFTWLPTLVAWALLRGISLHLHLQVDAAEARAQSDAGRSTTAAN